MSCTTRSSPSSPSGWRTDRRTGRLGGRGCQCRSAQEPIGTHRRHRGLAQLTDPDPPAPSTLPSVGAGEVLRDVLAADTIPRVRLTTIFRQAQQSGVVVNAHRINAGQPPVFGEHPDFFLFPADEPDATAERVVDLVARRIPRRFGILPREIQVLTPMHRGPAGAGTLNTLLQQALAPGREGTPERRHGARVFRPGDKVIQIRNNYDKGAAGVFNGTVGTITALSVTDQQLTVRTDEDEDIVYDFDELDELQHAYAITVHRSQGSEYPAVVVPLTMSAYTLLQRNLLYTAITRAKTAGRAGRQPQSPGHRGAHRRHRAPPHRPHPPPAETRQHRRLTLGAGQISMGPLSAVSPAATPPPVRGRSPSRWRSRGCMGRRCRSLRLRGLG